MSTIPQFRVPVGTMVAYGGAIDPIAAANLKEQGWLFCNGSLLSAHDYPDLYGAIGTSHGGDVNKRMFNLPDCRGMFLRGVDSGRKKDPDAGTRSAAYNGGNTGDVVGSIQDDSFASHQHDVPNLPQNLHYAVDEARRYDVAEFNSGSRATTSTGGSETRPRNLYVNFIIRYIP